MDIEADNKRRRKKEIAREFHKNNKNHGHGKIWIYEEREVIIKTNAGKSRRHLTDITKSLSNFVRHVGAGDREIISNLDRSKPLAVPLISGFPVVLDASVVVHPEGHDSAKVIGLVSQGILTLCTTADIQVEYHDILKRRGLDKSWISSLVTKAVDITGEHSISPELLVEEDESDNRYLLALGIMRQVFSRGILVSRDDHLLVQARDFAHLQQRIYHPAVFWVLKPWIQPKDD